MKKKSFWILILALIVITACTSAFFVFGPLVKQPKEKYIFIHAGDNYEKIRNNLTDNKIIPSGFFFDILAKVGKYKYRIKPGRYLVEDGSSMLSLFRKLRSGQQDPVRLVINKIRTRYDFAGKLGRNFDLDSADVIRFISSNDSLRKMNLDTNSFMTIIIPNTYLYNWNISCKSLLSGLKYQSSMFWNTKRRQKTKTLGIDSIQVYIIASIVEEETNKASDKGLIASVYLNRIRQGMPLQADPTVRFATGDFTIKRILNKHLAIESPYNTYRNPGLPPGPICTPSIATIDSVLNAPKTDYLYFAAKSDFKGYHAFARTYPEHLENARKYQKALDSLLAAKKKSNP